MQHTPVLSLSAVNTTRSVRFALAGRHLLVTGATGFLGKVFVAMLLAEIPDVRLTLLVRGRGGQSGAARMSTILETSPALRPLRAVHGDHLGAWLAARVQILDGDLLGGLQSPAARALAASVDLVVHLAGRVDFAPDPLLALSDNVDGAAAVADFTAQTPAKRLLHVSTCFVAGNARGPVPETLCPDRSPSGAPLDAAEEVAGLRERCALASSAAERRRAVSGRLSALGWPNIYTASKALSEALLSQDERLSLTIARPSIVESAERFPFPGWNEGMTTSAPLVWLLQWPLWRLPYAPERHLDFIPVDMVCRGLILLSALAMHGDAPPVAHLSTSEHAPLTMADTVRFSQAGYRAQAGTLSMGRWLSTQLPRTLLGGLDDSLLGPGALAAAGAGLGLPGLSTHFRRIDRMFREYAPFVCGEDSRFTASHVPQASRMLEASERQSFGFFPEAIDWERYWQEVHLPGLQRWCFPLLEGRRPPAAPPLRQPVRLVAVHR